MWVGDRLGGKESLLGRARPLAVSRRVLQLRTVGSDEALTEASDFARNNKCGKGK